MLKKCIRRGSLIAFSFFIALCSVFASSNITKEYTFKTDDTENIKYEADEYITKDLVKYKKEDVKITVLKDDRKVITKSFKADEKAPKEIKDGKDTYALRGEVKNQEKITLNKEYLSKEQVPSEIVENNKTLRLKKVDEKISREYVSLPAVFYGDSDSKYYIFNGKRLEIGDSPVWSGFEADVSNYLNLNSSYEILTGRFTSGFIPAEDTYIRYASYDAVRSIPVYEATYENDIAYEYVEKVKDKVLAKATVNYEVYNSLKKYMVFGLSLIAAITLATIIFFISKKRKKRG